MLNGDLKELALSELKAANREYQDVAARVTKQAEELYELRQLTSKDAIAACETYINSLANSPKEFDRSVAEFKLEYAKFTELIHEIELKSAQNTTVTGSVTGAGVAAGVGVAAFGPTAAMAIATTFGTASTGTAISALSGAAATNAALAWLGGGALAAGGGGMLAGNALLALSGPVGWVIGGVALAGSAFWMNSENEKVAKEAFAEAGKIRAETAKLRVAEREITNLFELTQQHADGVLAQLDFLRRHAPSDYQKFREAQKQSLAALINNIRSLSQLLNQKMS